MSHKRILRALTKFHGYENLTDWQLREIRRQHKLQLRRSKGPSEEEEMETFNAIKAEYILI